MDLTIESLSLRFGAVQALAGVDLRVAPGEVMVLAGPNGAGKSTLMSVILGLVRPDGGRILANGQEVATPDRATAPRLRERIGYLPEAPSFSENLTGRQVMRFFASARGIRRARLEEVLDRVGLADAAGRRVGGYSRGMRQRLGLGIAILSAPDLLVLDEPTGGLDQQGLTVLWRVLKEWRAAGRAVLLSTHELALIERRADRVCVLVDGKVRAQGTPAELRLLSGLEREIRIGPGLDQVYEELIDKEAAWDASVVH